MCVLTEVCDASLEMSHDDDDDDDDDDSLKLINTIFRCIIECYRRTECGKK